MKLLPQRRLTRKQRGSSALLIDPVIKEIRISGFRNTRKVTCPYCQSVLSVSLVPHMKKTHSKEWAQWTDAMLRLYNKTNDLKHVMREFSNNKGQLLFTWAVVDNEVKRKLETEGVAIQIRQKSGVTRWDPTADEYEKFKTTIWDVPRRGSWGVHQSSYRGNWAPQIPRAIIEYYSQGGYLILDPFVGGGTTLLEAWVLGRNAIGFDISQFALEVTGSRLRELDLRANKESLFGLPNVSVEVRNGDARILAGIQDSSVDLICTHPPYGNALQYSHGEPNDLSRVRDPGAFMDEIEKVGNRFFEVLRPGGFCAILIGDLRRDGRLHTFGFETVERFRRQGFLVEDIIIKT